MSDIPKVGNFGLRNIGNTCYMASIIQLLSHSKSFINFLLSDKESDKKEYNYYLEKATYNSCYELLKKKYNMTDTKAKEQLEKDKHSGLQQRMNDDKDKSIVHQFFQIINVSIEKGNSIIIPQQLKRCIDEKLPNFRGHQQHDAHELLIGILDKIIDETGKTAEVAINNIPQEIIEYIQYENTFREEAKKENPNQQLMDMLLVKIKEIRTTNRNVYNKYEGLKKMSEVYSKKYNPFIFNIQHFTITNIECSECNFISSTFTNNTVLSLNINSCSSLIDCFNLFIKPEELNDYECSFCKKKTKCHKSDKIWHPSKTLFIHLKRFNHLPSGRVIKDDSNIEIPDIINISDYCDNYMLFNTSHPISTTYSLRGFSNHHGGLGGGHYTADCLDVSTDEWYHFDDSNVQKVNKIDKSSAYVLMYELVL